MAVKVSLDRDAAVKALRHLEEIVPSLDRMGSLGSEISEDEHARILSSFFDDWGVGPKLAEVRRILSDAFDYDELEILFADVDTWTYGSRKPAGHDPDR